MAWGVANSHWKAEQSTIGMYLTNVTSWGQMGQSYMGRSFDKAEVVFMSEHKWKKKGKLEESMTRAGWKIANSSAVTGPHGGDQRRGASGMEATTDDT